ncbi:MAG: hypothetical protein CRN43_21545 [Candidatus Nephrothrix sp. EaCA]|nr:MAG: hypothetical protein CRN43_21545 [Candidatus Nephrothrix sp. EaCA]
MEISFFGSSGCFYFACFGGLFYFLVRQHIMDLFSAILSAPVMGFLEGANTFSLGMPRRAFAASVFVQKIIANKSSVYLRKPELKSTFMRHFRT